MKHCLIGLGTPSISTKSTFHKKKSGKLRFAGFSVSTVVKSNSRIRMIPKKPFIAACLALASLSQYIPAPAFVVSAHAQASENLINSIMNLRSEVESLYSRVQDGKQDHRANMRSFAAQKADLEAQINRQTISLKQLELDKEKVLADIQRTKSRNETLEPVLRDAQSLLRLQVVSGIPFKLNDRLKDVERLEAQLDANSITEERMLGQLWAGFEDILRMTRENGLFKQEIEVGGEIKLADVVKIGTVMLFFSLPDGTLGYVENTNEGINYTVTTNPLEREQIAILIDGLKKQIRTGYYELPAKFVFKTDKSLVVDKGAE